MEILGFVRFSAQFGVNALRGPRSRSPRVAETLRKSRRVSWVVGAVVGALGDQRREGENPAPVVASDQDTSTEREQSGPNGERFTPAAFANSHQ